MIRQQYQAFTKPCFLQNSVHQIRTSNNERNPPNSSNASRNQHRDVDDQRREGLLQIHLPPELLPRRLRRRGDVQIPPVRQEELRSGRQRVPALRQARRASPRDALLLRQAVRGQGG